MVSSVPVESEVSNASRFALTEKQNEERTEWR
jgi:hypothetical protein